MEVEISKLNNTLIEILKFKKILNIFTNKKFRIFICLVISMILTSLIFDKLKLPLTIGLIFTTFILFVIFILGIVQIISVILSYLLKKEENEITLNIRNEAIKQNLIKLILKFEELKFFKMDGDSQSPPDRKEYLLKITNIFNQMNQYIKEIEDNRAYEIFFLYTINRMKTEFKYLKKAVKKAQDICVVCGQVLEFPDIFPKDFPDDKKICCLCKDSWLYYYEKTFKPHYLRFSDQRLRNHYTEYKDKLERLFLIQ